MNSEIRESIKSIVRDDIPKGFIKTEAGVIPEDWDATKLGNRMRVFRGASPRPKGDTRYYGGDIPRLLIEDVTRDGKYAYPSIDSLTEEGAKKSRFLPKGSVVLSCSGTKVGIPGILGIDACIHDGFFGFDELDRIDPEFLYYFFGLLNIKLQSSATRGGVFNNLTTQIMKNLPVGLPEVSEQIKIVEVLSTWDKAIDLKAQFIEEKKQHKKGLMKKLLTGEVRLPGFESEWREVRIGELIKNKIKKTTANNQYQVLSCTKNGIVSQSEHFNKQIASENNIGYKILEKGDLVLSPMNLWLGGIDISCFQIGIVSPAYKVYSVDYSIVGENYLRNVLRT